MPESILYSRNTHSQALAAEKEALAERWDEQNSLLVESHERVIGELTEDYEAKLAEEALRIEQLQVRIGSPMALAGWLLVWLSSKGLRPCTAWAKHLRAGPREFANA
jgi:hypothetical protein